MKIPGMTINSFEEYVSARRAIHVNTGAFGSVPNDKALAVDYAESYGPTDQTRDIVTKGDISYYAFLYAKCADKAPSQQIEDYLVKSSQEDISELYALYEYVAFFNIQSDIVRELMAKDPFYAYCYAKNVDKARHPVTESAVADTGFEHLYEEAFQGTQQN